MTKDDLLSKVDLSKVGENPDENFGLGLTFNEQYPFGFFFNLPFLVTEIGVLQVNCKVDDGSMKCTVNVGIGSIGRFFEMIGYDVENGVLWVWQEADEYFSETVGPAIVSVFDNGLAYADGLFTVDNMRQTGLDIVNGLYSVPGVPGLVAGAAKAVVLFTPYEQEAASGIAEAVASLSQWGVNLVASAKSNADAAENDYDTAVSAIRGVFNGCDPAVSLQTFTSDCQGYKDILSGLSAVGNDIDTFIQNKVAPFFQSVKDWFLGASYDTVPTNQNTSDGCILYEYRQVTHPWPCGCCNLFGSCCSLPDCTVYKSISTAPSADCVRERATQVLNVNDLANVASLKTAAYEAAVQDNLASATGANLTADQLLSDVINCTQLYFREDPPFLQITCATSIINKDGTISDEKVMLSRNTTIDVNDANVTLSQADYVKAQLKEELANHITSAMNREPVSCTPTPGPPGDGIDNDCNSLIDDNTFCNYDDGVNGIFTKDCRCRPPFLSRIADVSICCADDYSTTALGVPNVTVDGSCALAPAAGSFFQITAPSSASTDPSTHCGAGVLVRQHYYRDQNGQLSNTVNQTINLQGTNWTIDTSSISPVAYVACEAFVNVNECLNGTCLKAPYTNETADTVGCRCAQNLDKGFVDLSLEYVGCPENPPDGSTKFKGWDVNRQFFVKDQCGHIATYNQTVVRIDETAPSFTTVPPVRLQSCRASIDPLYTGYPTATDNCDPANVINPDWTNSTPNGRITYSDQGVNTGCPESFQRTFVARDRVCNQITTTHTIQATAFEFQPQPGSLTTYDPTSFLPTFVYQSSSSVRQYFSNDVLRFIDDTLAVIAVRRCQMTGLEYLDPSLQNAVWTAVNDAYNNGVFKLDATTSSLAIQISPPHRPVFQTIASVYGGYYRSNVTCVMTGGAANLQGSVMFRLQVN